MKKKNLARENVRVKLAFCAKFMMRWGWYIALVVIATTVATELLPDTPSAPSYQARLNIQVQSSANLTSAKWSNASANFFSSLFTSPSTLSLLLPKYPGFQVTDLQGLVTAIPVTGTNYVQVTATFDSSESASQLVTAVYAAALQDMQTQRTKLTTALLANLETELRKEQSDAASSSAALQALQQAHRESSFAYIQTESLYNIQLQNIAEINKQLIPLQSGQESITSLLRLASASPTITTVPPSAPTEAQRLAVSPLIGLFMGLGGVLLASYFSRRKKMQDQEHALPQTIATVPRLPGLRDNVVEVVERESPCLPLYRRLLYQASEYEQKMQVITVTSVVDGEGKSLIATGLAVAAARNGKRTVLIDAHPQHPTQHIQFNCPNAPGILEAVTAFAAGQTMFPVLSTRVPDLGVIPVGNDGRTGNTAVDPFPLSGLQPFIEFIRSKADIIILDAPSLSGDTGCLNLVMGTDLVLLVVDAKKRRDRLLLEAEHLISVMNINSALVLNPSTSGGATPRIPSGIEVRNPVFG